MGTQWSLGEAIRQVKKSLDPSREKGNDNHDAQGRFASADTTSGSGHTAGEKTDADHRRAADVKEAVSNAARGAVESSRVSAVAEDVRRGLQNDVMELFSDRVPGTRWGT
jgi:hypothetical protein